MYSSQDIFRACETFQFPLPFKNNSGNKWIPKGFRRLNFFSGFDLLPSFLLPYGTVQKAAKALALVLVLLLALQMGMFSCSKTLKKDFLEVRLTVEERQSNLCSKNQFFRENVIVIAFSELRPGSNERYENSTFYGPFRFLIYIHPYI